MQAPVYPSRTRWRTPLVLAWMVLAMSGPALELVAPATTDRADWQWPFGLLIFVAGSLAWGTVVDGFRPDRFDLIGAAICLLGVAVIMYAPR